MTAEEIRKGIDRLLLLAIRGSDVRLDALKSELSSWGVVIIDKDRELPTQRWDELIEHDWIDFTPNEVAIMKLMLENGYVAVKPLILEIPTTGGVSANPPLIKE